MLNNHFQNIDAHPIHRQAMYLGSAEEPLFGILHSAQTVVSRNCITVICPPIGHEYTHSHRAVRHLADALARNGIPALRLDYHSIGDSPGVYTDDDRVARWLSDIGIAIAEARRISHGAPICLLGIRMGAALASMVAAEVDVDWLVSWFPVISGRRYVRELQAIGRSTQSHELAPDAPLEAAGFALTKETEQSLKAINLLKLSTKANQGILLVQRDDMEIDDNLRDHLALHTATVESIVCAGYTEMVAQPLYTSVPQLAIDATVAWLTQHSTVSTVSAQSFVPEARPSEMHFDFTAMDDRRAELIETACRYGEENSLFGIHVRPLTLHPDTPIVVIFSAGVVHRVGPGGLYTEVARNLAAQGIPSFRCDLDGIGDSVLCKVGRENHPYPDSATNNAEATLNFLQQRFGAKQFILMGLCSGAYVSFMASLSVKKYVISEAVLINPPTFKWVEGDNISADHFRQVAYYRGSIRKGSSWKKLLRGQVNLLKLGRLLMAHIASQSRSHLRSVMEWIYPQAGPVLGNQLRSLYKRKCHISLFISSDEPGWDILTAGARQAVRQGLKRGNLSSHFIVDSDHTFSNQGARSRVINELCTHLQRHIPKSDDKGTATSAVTPTSLTAVTARPEIIVLARNVTGLQTVRCLSKVGIQLHAIYFNQSDPIRFSRYCIANFFDDSEKNEQALIDHLVAYTRKLTIRPIVIPTCDEHALLLAKHQSQLEPYCTVMTATFSSLESVIHKHNLHAQAELAGIAIIPSIVAPSLSEVTAWAELNEAPYLVKPFYTGTSSARLKQKNLVLPTREDLFSFVNEGEMQALIIQRVIAGGDGYIFDCYGYCNKYGEIVAMASKRRLRQNLPDYGTCTMGEIPAYLDENTEATIFANTRQLFAHIKYQGIFGVEWLFDRQKKVFYLIDFNARPFMSISHVAAAGLNLPALAYAEMSGEDISHVEQTPRLKHLIGVDLLRDMESFRKKRHSGEATVIDWLLSISRCRHFYYTDWRDPGPALARALEIIHRGFFYLFNSNTKMKTRNSISSIRQ